jgi:hypothetical protein
MFATSTASVLTAIAMNDGCDGRVADLAALTSFLWNVLALLELVNEAFKAVCFGYIRKNSAEFDLHGSPVPAETCVQSSFHSLGGLFALIPGSSAGANCFPCWASADAMLPPLIEPVPWW